MLWAFPCGPKLSDTGCGFPALWFANSTDFLHTFNFSLQIRFLWLLFPQTHRYDRSIKVYTLKLIGCTWRHWTFPDNTRQWCPVSPSFEVILDPGRRMESKLPPFSILDSCVWCVSTSFQHTIDFLCCLPFETLPNKVPLNFFY
jgi:hypothetical protein